MGLSGSGHIIGPFFSERNLNGKAYLQMLNEEIISRLFELYGDRVDHLWWMQDGAPCHRTNVVRKRLREIFGNRIIELRHAVEWPPRRPDLTPCFFCEAIWKTKSMKHPQLIRKIYEIVSDAVAEHSDHPEMIRNSMRGMRKRCQKCFRTRWRILAIIGLILLPWRILVMLTFVAMKDIGYNRITFVVIFKHKVM